MPKLLAAALLALAATGPVRVLDLENRAIDPFQADPGIKAIVFLFTSTDCPISNRYAPEVRRIVEKYASQGVVFRLVYPGPNETVSAIREHMAAFSYEGTIEAVRDPRLALVKLIGATITPEAAVYTGGRVVYRGRIDDRYVDLGLERPSATMHDLADAIGAAITGKPIAHATTQAVGCFIADLAR